MCEIWNSSEIWNGLLTNIITLVLTLLIAWFLYASFGRRGLLKFFGVENGKLLRIYVGHVPFPSVPKGFVGFEEISEAKNIEALFKSVIPGLGEQPGLLKFLQVADIQTEILPGEMNHPDVTLDHSLISLGSPTSNFASLLLETELKNPVKCDRNTGNIQIPHLPPIADNQVVVVRICSGDKNYFYIAGKYEPTTAGGARFLIQNWKSMRKSYGDRTSFYYLLEVRNDSRRSVISVANNELQITG
ncbi:MAG: hypothetical protein ACLPYZ_05385 [Limisphaerales bacterium]